MSKSNILQNIRQALKDRENPSLKATYKDITIMQKHDLLEEYIRTQKENMASVIVSSPANLTQDIQQVLKDSGARRLLHALDLPCRVQDLSGVELIAYDSGVEERRADLFHIDTSIVKACCGVANLGIMGLISSIASPRLASLISEHCIVLLDSSCIVRNFLEGIEFLKNQSADGVLPTNLLFVAGPSRTADIELQTVFGVHGPRKVTTILY